MKLQLPDPILALIRNFSLPPELGFGTVMAPVMISCDYEKGEWKEAEILPYGPLSLYPTCKALHYAQEIFEGLKAYKVDNNGPYLFRPIENAKRLNISATRMAMPEFPIENFVELVQFFTSICAPLVPQKSGESLYLRPFMFATEESLGIKPSETFKFLIIASPSGAYVTGDSMKALIEREYVRAVPGGTGFAKTGGNYSRSLLSAAKAKKLGMNQSLWLDSKHRCYVEELSGMNFFAVIKNVLHTPYLNDTILKGITRDSVLEIAKREKIKVHEGQIDINNLIEEIKSGDCSEIFACGTAAIITPISVLCEENGTKYIPKNANAPIGQKIRKILLDLQEGREEDPFNWRLKITPYK